MRLGELVDKLLRKVGILPDDDVDYIILSVLDNRGYKMITPDTHGFVSMRLEDIWTWFIHDSGYNITWARLRDRVDSLSTDDIIIMEVDEDKYKFRLGATGRYLKGELFKLDPVYYRRLYNWGVDITSHRV